MRTNAEKIDSYWLNKPESNVGLYFAYGSNINQEQMRHRCKDSKPVALAYLKNYRFIINSQGVATIIPSANSIVRGVLWQISESDESQLDKYEGVSSNLYRKEICTALVNDDSMKALVYVATESSLGLPREKYLETILHGLVSFGVSEQWIEEIKIFKQ